MLSFLPGSAACGGCCCGRCESNAEISSEISWQAGPIDNTKQTMTATGKSTLPTIVSEQPSMTASSSMSTIDVSAVTRAGDENTNTLPPPAHFVDVDFGIEASYEADRFTDMSETIFKRHS